LLGIDAQPLMGPKTGVYRYLKTLLDEWLTGPSAASMRLFAFQFLRECALPGNDGWSGYDLRCVRRFPGRFYFKMLQLQIAFPLDFGCDTYFFPNFVGYPVRRGRTFVTVHDLAYLRFPQFTEWKNLLYLRMALPAALRRADHIVAVSQTTANDVEEFFRMGEKVTVVPTAVSPVFFENRDPVLPEDLGLERPFLLCVGTIEPRKNLETLLEAWAMMRDRPDLVVVGAFGWLYEPIRERMQRMGPGLHHIEGLDPADLPAVYNLARVLAHPAWYEGFGLPPLEAMACGTPVVAARVGGLVTTVHDGFSGRLVDGHDPVRYGEVLTNLLMDDDARRALSVGARQHAEGFGWDRTVGGVMDVYADAVRAAARGEGLPVALVR